MDDQRDPQLLAQAGPVAAAFQLLNDVQQVGVVEFLVPVAPEGRQLPRPVPIGR